MIVQRTEKHILKCSDVMFEKLDHCCFLAKNLYNHANYVIRKQYIDDGTWLRYPELDKLLRADSEYPDYKNMPNAVAAQQLLRYLDNAWSAFFTAIKDWKVNPGKYQGKPNPPDYKHKTRGRCPIYLTNQACILREGYIVFPKAFDRIKVKVNFVNKSNVVNFLQTRILPRGNHIVLEFVYSEEVPETKEDNERYLGIDIGVDNLAAVSNNVGLLFYLIDGKGLKSMNKYYNKLVAHYSSKLQNDQKNANKSNKQYMSKRLQRIHSKRNFKIDDYLHKASRWIINFAQENNINVIVVGKNDLWKQKSNLGHTTNQTFVQIPHARFINMIKYKAEEFGIQVIEQEESYTSKTSFLDNEYPTKNDECVGRRIQRGLLRSGESSGNQIINADSNGALQIIKKHNPNFKVTNLVETRILLQTPKRINVT